VSGRRAAFLDRDGTIIYDSEDIKRPEEVILLEGAANGIRRLNQAGIPVIVVTNQSGIARGVFTEADYQAVRHQLEALLAAEGAHLDGSYHCPHHPDFTGPCLCRKPGILLFELAAADHGLDLARSWYVGDRFRDVAPALRFGGEGFLTPSNTTTKEDFANATGVVPLVESVALVVDRILGSY
jgi:histidinol-phosphate phosphatase family protein